MRILISSCIMGCFLAVCSTGAQEPRKFPSKLEVFEHVKDDDRESMAHCDALVDSVTTTEKGHIRISLRNVVATKLPMGEQVRLPNFEVEIRCAINDGAIYKNQYLWFSVAEDRTIQTLLFQFPADRITHVGGKRYEIDPMGGEDLLIVDGQNPPPAKVVFSKEQFVTMDLPVELPSQGETLVVPTSTGFWISPEKEGVVLGHLGAGGGETDQSTLSSLPASEGF